MTGKKVKKDTEKEEPKKDMYAFIQGFQELLIKTHVVQFHHNDDGLTSLTFKNGDVLYLKDLMNCCVGKDKW